MAPQTQIFLLCVNCDLDLGDMILSQDHEEIVWNFYISY